MLIFHRGNFYPQTFRAHQIWFYILFLRILSSRGLWEMKYCFLIDYNTGFSYQQEASIARKIPSPWQQWSQLLTWYRMTNYFFFSLKDSDLWVWVCPLGHLGQKANVQAEGLQDFNMSTLILFISGQEVTLKPCKTSFSYPATMIFFFLIPGVSHE